MIKFMKGNILDTNCPYLVQQVNCCGVMGGGLAKQIADRWPIVRDKYIEEFTMHPGSLLGTIQFVKINPVKTVINIFAQNYYGTGGRYTNYEAFYQSMLSVYTQTPPKAEIAVSYKIGCGLGGADWDIIFAMIKNIFENSDKTVIIYSLGD